MVRPFLLALGAILVAAASPPPGWAASHDLEQILPGTTKAMVAIQDVGKLTEQFNTTGLGRLIKDPALEPFLADLKQQLQAKMLETGVELGVDLEELRGVVTGPAGVAAIQPGNQPQQAAIVLMAYVAGQEQRAQALIQRGLSRLDKHGARRSTDRAGDATLQVIEFPIAERTQRACYVLHQGWFIVADHKGTMLDLLARLKQDDGRSLAALPAYQACLDRSQAAEAEQIRWFVDPFGYVEVMRAVAARHGACHRGDIAEVLASQGFDVVRGLGGRVWVGQADAEVTHRTFVYAPGDAAGPRFRLAARMLDFPNSSDLQAPLAWLPSNLSMQATFNLNIQGAFEAAGSLVNALAKDEVFEDVLDSIKNDPNGPQVDLRHELVAHLGQRVSIMSDYVEPIGPTSERALCAVELARSAPVAEAVNRALGADPSVNKTMIGDQIVWEIINEVPEQELVALEIEGEGFGFGSEGFGAEEPVSTSAPPGMPNFAVAVTDTHLLISTQVSLIADVLVNANAPAALAEAQDFQRVSQHLEGLSPGAGSMQMFLRPESLLKPGYELMRANQMAESKSPLAMVMKLVNNNQAPREQKIDGSKLPPFSAIAQYLGPAGMKLATEEDGWFLSGSVLPRRQ